MVSSPISTRRGQPGRTVWSRTNSRVARSGWWPLGGGGGGADTCVGGGEGGSGQTDPNRGGCGVGMESDSGVMV
ncbi:hypothetical protein S83_023950 [Arachis hypogaea]